MSTILPSCCRDGGDSLTEDDADEEEDKAEDDAALADDELSSTGSKLPMRNERISSKLLSLTIGNGSDDADAKGGNDDGMELEEARSTRRQTKISCAERAKISIAVELSNISDSGGDSSEC